MNIQEMHSAFRTICQQMGLQLVRGILPESIDVFINNVIQEKVQQELLAGTRTVIQETVDTQASTMGSINILRSLYRTDRILLPYPNHYSKDSIIQGASKNNVVIWDKNNPTEFENGMLVDYYNPDNGYHEILIPLLNKAYIGKNWVSTDGEGEWEDLIMYGQLNPMLYLGINVEYPETKRGNAVSCRMIGADVLETTMRDFCNGASKDSPIVTLLSKTKTISDFDDKLSTINQPYFQIYINSKNTIFKAITIKYIKQPDVVKHDLALENCINCDLPEYCHYEIVEKAVIKYQMSIGAQVNSRDNNR